MIFIQEFCEVERRVERRRERSGEANLRTNAFNNDLEEITSLGQVKSFLYLDNGILAEYSAKKLYKTPKPVFKRTLIS